MSLVKDAYIGVQPFLERFMSWPLPVLIIPMNAVLHQKWAQQDFLLICYKI